MTVGGLGRCLKQVGFGAFELGRVSPTTGLDFSLGPLEIVCVFQNSSSRCYYFSLIYYIKHTLVPGLGGRGDGHIPATACKNKKYDTVENPTEVVSKVEDHISALPDCLIIHILSLLPTTRDAVRTGTLSKRWLYLWTHLPNLIFHLKDEDDAKLLHFANHVDKTLTLHASPKLQKFILSGLDVDNLQVIAPRLSFWLRFAILRKAQDISLVFEGDRFLDIWDDSYYLSYCYMLPKFFYNNPSLRNLKTKCCNFAPTGKVEWTSLRVLEIGYSALSQETLNSILSGSPVLESLRLYKCVGIDEVDIGSSCNRLKTLVIDDLWLSTDEKEYTTYFISGSSIQHLEIYGNGLQKWELDNMPSLVSVKLDFQIVPPGGHDEDDEEEDEEEEGDNNYHEMCREVVRELLEKVGHVEQLKLGSWCIQVLSTLELKGVSAPFIDCKHLIFTMEEIDQWSFPGMASLLRSSSKLEKLAIEFSGQINCFSRQFDDPDLSRYELEDNYWRSNKRICKYLFSQLKTIEILRLSEGLYKEGFLFQLIEFLLKNARLLEKMTVQRDSNWETKNVVMMMVDLLSFPRLSPRAVVMSRK